MKAHRLEAAIWGLGALLMFVPQVEAQPVPEPEELPQAPAAAPLRPAVATDPNAPTVTARLEKSTAMIGDVVTLTVSAVSSRKTPVNLPANIDLSPFEIVDRRETETALGEDKFRREFVFQIAAFDTGELTVPALSLTYLAEKGAVRSVSTLPLTLTIKSLLANEPDPALKTNANPVPVLQEVRWPLYVLGGLVAALLGALLGSYWLARWRRREKVVPVVPPRPAHEVALERLERLAAGLSSSEVSVDGLRPFYFELSEILREYFGGRFGFDSLELTTDELMDELRRHAGKPLMLSQVEGWLSSCDLVKFARVAPSLQEAQAALEQGLQFVMVTKPAPPAATAEPSEPNEVAHG